MYAKAWMYPRLNTYCIPSRNMHVDGTPGRFVALVWSRKRRRIALPAIKARVQRVAVVFTIYQTWFEAARAMRQMQAAHVLRAARVLRVCKWLPLAASPRFADTTSYLHFHLRWMR